MKRTMRIAWLLSMLLLACALTFTACNGGDDAQTTSGTTDETTTGKEDETTTGAEDETTTGAEDETTAGKEDETTTGKEDETTSGKEDETTGAEPPVHEHSFGEWKITKEATCTAQGEAERACACGEKEIKPLEMKPHTEVVDAAKAPTCTETGLTEGKHCSVCKTVLKAQETVKANGHTEVTDAAKAPTCTETGLTEGKHCSVCKEVLKAQEVVKANGHTYSTAWEQNDTHHWHKAVCEHSTEISAKGEHSFGDDLICDVCEYEKNVAVDSLTLNLSDISMEVGEVEYLIAVITPENATDRSVTWTSTDPSVAIVNNGTVVGVGVGHAIIIVTTPNGKVAMCNVTVSPKTVPVTDIRIDKTQAYINVGEQVTLSATVIPENATEAELLWSSSDTTVASVENGVVTALCEGTVTVTVSTKDGSVSKTCEIVVENNALRFVTYGEGYALKGCNVALESIVIPDTYHGKPVRAILADAFSQYCGGVKELTIGANVTYISQGVLKPLQALEQLNVKNHVTCDHFGELFGSVTVSFDGGLDTFFALKTVAGSLPGAIYMIPAPYTDWRFEGDVWFEYEGKYYLLAGKKIPHASVLSWQTDYRGYESFKVPKRVEMQAYCIPYNLKTVCVTGSLTCSFTNCQFDVIDVAALALKNTEICVGNVSALQLYANGKRVDASVADLISAEDAQKLTQLGTHEIAVNYGPLTKTFSVTVTDHTQADAIIENKIDPTCTEEGGYEAVVNCAVCGCMLSRTQHSISPTHTPAEAVGETRVESTCEKEGSYDSVIYCAVCGTEISREAKTIDCLPHTFGEWTVAKTATETENGVRTHTCQLCAHTETVRYQLCDVCDGNGHTSKTEDCPDCSDGYKYSTCSRCNGSGKYGTSQWETCSVCEGEGIIFDAFGNLITCICGGKGGAYVKPECSSCDGDGRVTSGKCLTCEGKKTIPVPIACASCDQTGGVTVSVLDCETNGDVPMDAVKEGFVDSTCSKEGFYEEVVYCAGCGKELSRVRRTVEKKAHSASNPTVENRIEPTCTENGSYESVVSCLVCGEELLREKSILNAAHQLAAEVIENRTEPTCTEKGFYDSVISCSVCQAEVSRNRVTLSAKGHTKAEAVIENRTEPTCTEKGFYDSVIYCSVCQAEVSRSRVTLNAKGHTKAEAVTENRTEPTCTEKGFYDSVIYCSVCQAEVSRSRVTLNAKGHTKADAVTENRTEPTCTEEGACEEVVYCRDCHKEMSRTPSVLLRAHRMEDGACSVCLLPASSEGLAVQLNADGKGYTVVGIGTCTETELKIGAYGTLSITAIQDGAFANCYQITDVIVGHSVTSIGEDAFSGCLRLERASLGNAQTIGSAAFGGCRSLMRVDLPNGITTIEASVFEDCGRLADIYIPQSVTRIKEKAFAGCESLSYVSFADDSRLSRIDANAFYGCSALKSLTLPNSISHIEAGALSACSALETLTVPFVGGSAKKGTNGTLSPFGYIFGKQEYVGGVAVKQYNALSVDTYETGVTTYYIPASLQTVTVTRGNIWCSAFLNCSMLVDVTLPEGLTAIGMGAFSGCSSLKSIVLPEGLTTIGDTAFRNCGSLESVTIPESVNQIISNAFYGCTQLKNVYISNMESWYNISFGNGPANPLNSGAALVVNGTPVTELRIPDGMTYVPSYAFYGCGSIEQVIFSDSVTIIGGESFGNCRNMESIIIPTGIKTVCSRAFDGSGLQTVYCKFGYAWWWDRIDLTTYNGGLVAATDYYYRATKPTATGFYWHYDENGVPTKW